ncbi:NAD-dependent dehydratase [Candidatus Woesearchaeota archaeon]|nr:NAD-dependent dehydratase [Candidatus Woesearchaeota archaeon]|tara:strand:- start:6116 stop:7153 length:1038 start_codon:yes stop_codon:yes gene_type:complete
MSSAYAYGGKSQFPPHKFVGILETNIMKALITGGLGFVGSNLAHKLASIGVDVTVIDAMIPDLGGNYFNIDKIKEKITVIEGDIRDKNIIEESIKHKDVIFHLAGQVDHKRSINRPYEDASIRIDGTLSVLEACRKHNPSAKIIYSSTRGVYGEPKKVPVNEDNPTNPLVMYAITSLAAENILKMYGKFYGTKTTILRLVNIYGPRHQMKHSYGIANYFIMQSLSHKPMTIMGTGKILRDFLFVDDACDAFIECSKNSGTDGKIFNVGSGKGTSFIELANEIKNATDGKVNLVKYTKVEKQLEPGNFIADITKITNETKWCPKTKLGDGIKKTVDFYNKNKKHYW